VIGDLWLIVESL